MMMNSAKIFIFLQIFCVLAPLWRASGAAESSSESASASSEREHEGARILCLARCVAKCARDPSATIPQCRSVCSAFNSTDICSDKSCWRTCKTLGAQTAKAALPPDAVRVAYAADNFDVNVEWAAASGVDVYIVQYSPAGAGRWHAGDETISRGAQLSGLRPHAETLCGGLDVRVASVTLEGGIGTFSEVAQLEQIQPNIKPELKSMELVKKPHQGHGDYFSNETVVVTLGYKVKKWIFSSDDIEQVQVYFHPQSCEQPDLSEAVPLPEFYDGPTPKTVVGEMGAEVMYRSCSYIATFEAAHSKRCDRVYALAGSYEVVTINCRNVKNCETVKTHKAPKCSQVDDFNAEIINENDINWYDPTTPISVNVTFRHTPRREKKPQPPLYFVARYGDATEYNTSDQKSFVGVEMVNEFGNATNCLEFDSSGMCKKLLPPVNESEGIYSIIIANLSMDRLYGVAICTVFDIKNLTFEPLIASDRRHQFRVDRIEIRSVDHRVSRRDFWLAMIGAVVASLLVVLAVGFFVWTRRQRAIIKRKKLSLAAMQKETEKRYVDFPRRDDVWELERRNLIIYDDRKLGSGAFGAVYLGRLIGAAKGSKDGQSTLGVNLMRANNCEVAVKMLPEYADELSKSEFLREISLMKTLGYHERLVNMLACVTNSEPYCLVVECCGDGDLLHFLKARCAYMLELEEKKIDYSSYDSVDEFDSDMVITVKELLQFTVQISYGLEYLSQKGFVHRDVAARNVLVHDKHYVKIGDFGLCRFIYADSANYKSKGGRLPIKWMSPEAIRHYEFTTKSDVWSFGVLMFEIITLGGTPYPGIQPDDMLSFLESGCRIAKPDNCPDEFYDVMSSCWEAKPDDRPEFAAIRRLLAVHLEGITDEYSYLKLDAQKDYYNVAYTEKCEQAGELLSASDTITNDSQTLSK